MTSAAFPTNGYPEAAGLYDPANERDACGLAMVATLRGTPGHDIIDHALDALRHMEHRGAVGSDAGTGDGAGILTQIPDEFFRAVSGFELPAEGRYAVGNAYLPVDSDERARVKAGIVKLAAEEDLRVIGWREVPVQPDELGKLARAAMPVIEQLYVRSERQNFRGNPRKGASLDRQCYRLRKRAEHSLGVYFMSLSCRMITYKGMVTTLQLEPFFPDLGDERFASKLAIVHSRYSTNTFPSWQLAQPMRMMAHNGEINTVRGNRNWMRARQSQLRSEILGDVSDLFPIVTEGASDSASFDEVLELLTLSGRSLSHAVHMMVPAAWETAEDLSAEVRDFYEYHSLIMEPWDGPAAMAFTDGRYVCATLDRNGLRPGRFVQTADGLIVLGSEVGVASLDPATVIRKGRLRPGQVLLVDTEVGRLIEDDEVKHDLAELQPWGDWLDEGRINLAELPEREHVTHTPASVERRQRTFGYTEEELRILLAPMAKNGAEPIGAMGTDTPIAILTDRPRLVFDYFTQNFAQVTNPPLDAIREEVVTSLTTSIGPQENLLSAGPEHARQVVLDFPVIDNDQLAKIQHIEQRPGIDAAETLRGCYRIDDGVEGLRKRLEELCEEADRAIDAGAGFLVLSDRDSNRDYAPIPSLLMTSAVHHHLIRTERRMRVGLVIEAGDVREVHHVAVLLGYGASAVNPYLAMESCEDMVRQGKLTGVTEEKAVANLIKALGKGVLKIMSKMGISAVASYAGAQCFEAVGLSNELVSEYFTGTASKISGMGLEGIARENELRHRHAYPAQAAPASHRPLDIGGEYQWRREGPPHLFNPNTIFRLQHSTREGRYDIFKEYTKLVDDQAAETMTLRGLFKLKVGERPPVPIDEVEPASEILRRFQTGAMSYGSISKEAHETLAIAMNRIGGKSNTGEGGEDVERLLDPERRSAIKQVASGRFGVTSMYLTHADDIQIKLAQGAKPGEGGQLPPTKVYPWVARTRHATPGVGLISPPPHHDIYSIEDLKQLIFDLKRANPSARIHVKLVSENGIGAVAAGVTKALADVVLVSGHDGGTGASPLNSLKHAGTPWELGLAETQQTLMLNGLRDRVVVQVDGQLKTGRDVIVGALLGAEEFGFATAALVVSGCIMMRVCHLDTCPVGVATQNPELRARYTGQADHVVNFFEFVAQEVREYLAELGVRSLDEIIGKRELLEVDDAMHHWKTEGLDLSRVLTGHEFGDAPTRSLVTQEHELDQHFDQKLLELAEQALENGESVKVSMDVINTDRAVGTMLGHHVTRGHGEHGLPAGTIDIELRGTAGQSLGAFLPNGIRIRLVGDSNDYVGKGLSGGEIILRPDERAPFKSHENVIAGNVIGYGATSGTMFLSGVVGERFLVRNSGATAVAEAVGDHALEYMTGGLAVILGETGKNFGAGMSGGIAYVHKLDPKLVNPDMLSTGELGLTTLTSADADILRDILERHAAETDSQLAREMLDDFDAVSKEFTKVLPRDYAKVTEIRNAAIERGGDPDDSTTWHEILEATRG
ncbi:glutamate synthase large subunit [Pseudoclavibacter terrae]|uniref:glutamate synthase large subunit n=1 Tax=Pseudoclavibacter terrae TaxID=1530195 RepID=UPI00232B70AF|nr:glutamate synthase large subunit [Pseudoclavibacter terrae]